MRTWGTDDRSPLVLVDTKQRLVNEGMQSQPCRAMLKSVLIGEVDGKCHCCMSEVISRHIVIFFVISFQFAAGHTKEPSLFFSWGTVTWDRCCLQTSEHDGDDGIVSTQMSASPPPRCCCFPKWPGSFLPGKQVESIEGAPARLACLFIISFHNLRLKLGEWT